MSWRESTFRQHATDGGSDERWNLGRTQSTWTRVATRLSGEEDAGAYHVNNLPLWSRGAGGQTVMERDNTSTRRLRGIGQGVMRQERSFQLGVGAVGTTTVRRGGRGALGQLHVVVPRWTSTAVALTGFVGGTYF